MLLPAPPLPTQSAHLQHCQAAMLGWPAVKAFLTALRVCTAGCQTTGSNLFCAVMAAFPAVLELSHRLPSH